MLDWLADHLGPSPISYIVVLASVALNGVFPIVPSATVVITAGILANEGSLGLPFVAAAAPVGAITGDHASYGLGRLLSERTMRRLSPGRRPERIVDWAKRQIRVRGALVVIVARFIPGARTPAAVAAGGFGLEYRRFLPADVVGASLWALYVVMLGYVGGARFEESLWKPLLLAFLVATAVALTCELARRHKDGTRRRGARAASGRS